LQDFKSKSKPIGLCCIAPVIVAKAFPGCTVTIGSDANVANAIRSLGSNHVERAVDQVAIDENNKIVTAPAYMCDASLAQVFKGIDEMVKATLNLSKE
jgi:enhancing lycopene biosynthesis protein 2